MEEITITSFSTHDVRFPTSLDKTGSDAMNAAGDYSAAYCILKTDSKYTGHGMTFTIGRGNDIICHAIPHIASRLLHRTLTSPRLKHGPHLAATSIRFPTPLDRPRKRILGKPVWKVVAEMNPEEFVRCVDFRYIEDAITPEEGVDILRKAREGREERLRELEESRAVPAYTTSAGWLGYGEENMRGLLEEMVQKGYRHFKMKVGGGMEVDRRRLGIARDVIGYDRGNVLMIDANQVWSVPEAIEYMQHLAEFKPWSIEEPTSPDDILGHATIRRALLPSSIAVASGEVCQNRIIFKQLLTTHSIDICQPDACRLGGLNEVLAVLLMAKKFNIPVVPHSGGVGLPEYMQHLSIIDYVCVGGEKSLLEFVDCLHEHFERLAGVEGGYYRTPMEEGYSMEMKKGSMRRFEFPGERGGWWRGEEARGILEGVKI